MAELLTANCNADKLPEGKLRYHSPFCLMLPLHNACLVCCRKVKLLNVRVNG